MNKCKHLKRRTKCVITKKQILYGTMYKCELKSEQEVASIQLACRKCPRQYEMFDEEMTNERLER